MGVSRFAPLLVVALLAGCGSTPPPPAPTPTPPPSPTYGPPPQGGLSLSAGQVEAGRGHRASVLTLSNRDTVRRRVAGCPGLEIPAGDGSPLGVQGRDETSYFAPDAGPQDLTLRRGERA